MNKKVCIEIYERLKKENISISLERGWPSEEQLSLSLPMLDIVTSETELVRDCDYRGYAGTAGIKPLKKVFAEVLDVNPDNIYIGGTMSTTIMYDIVSKFYIFGKDGSTPWSKLEKVKFICPSPGYEKHFKICKTFNIEMIPVGMNDDGPDMGTVEKLVTSDDSIKGIWCVPLYSNPTGCIYSDETVRRLAAMKTAADDFIVMWDNAYCVHHLSDVQNEILNILEEARKFGTDKRVFEFTSTSKITFPGGGVGVCASSRENIKWITDSTLLQLKTGDKINQLRHYLFLPDKNSLLNHMRKHAAIIKPKFDLIDEIFKKELREIKGVKWNNPMGGYFCHLELLPGMAKDVWQTCKDLGVSITPAGSTYPYGIDPEDKTLRLAPTFLSKEDLEKAMMVLCCAIKYVYVNKFE